jgi:hypothetical protein
MGDTEVVEIPDLGWSVYRVDGGTRVEPVNDQPWSNLCASQCVARMRDLLRTLQSAPGYDQAQANRLQPFRVTPSHFTPGMRPLFRKAWAAFEMHDTDLDTHDLRELYRAVVGGVEVHLPYVFVDAAGAPHAWFVRSQTQPNQWVSVLQHIQGRSAPDNALATRFLSLPDGPEDPFEVLARLSVTNPTLRSSLTDLIRNLILRMEKAEGRRGSRAADDTTFQSQLWTDTRRSPQALSPFLSLSP